MSIIFAIIGFVAGVAIGTAVFVLVINDERHAVYQLIATRHPWIRLVSILWNIACGALMAFFAYALAE